MPTDHSEKGFEGVIEHHLTTVGGYRKGLPAAFDATLGLVPSETVAFLRESQPKAWERLEGFYGADVDTKVVQLVAKSLDQRGTLDVLRHGITDRGVALRLMTAFEPRGRCALWGNCSLRDRNANGSLHFG